MLAPGTKRFKPDGGKSGAVEPMVHRLSSLDSEVQTELLRRQSFEQKCESWMSFLQRMEDSLTVDVAGSYTGLRQQLCTHKVTLHRDHPPLSFGDGAEGNPESSPCLSAFRTNCPSATRSFTRSSPKLSSCCRGERWRTGEGGGPSASWRIRDSAKRKSCVEISCDWYWTSSENRDKRKVDFRLFAN